MERGGATGGGLTLISLSTACPNLPSSPSPTVCTGAFAASARYLAFALQGVLWSQPARERKGKKKVKKKAAKTGQPNDRVQEMIEDVEERILMQDFPDLSRIASSEESETVGNFKRKISDEEEEDERKRGKRRPFSKVSPTRTP